MSTLDDKTEYFLLPLNTYTHYTYTRTIRRPEAARRSTDLYMYYIFLRVYVCNIYLCTNALLLDTSHFMYLCVYYI